MYFSENLGAIADNTLVHNALRRYVLRRKIHAVGIDLPEFLIEVEFRYNIDQLHIGFPVRTKRPYILPISVVLIGKHPHSLCAAVRNDMLPEVTVRLAGKPDQRFLQNRPAENINSHGCQVTAGPLRLFFKSADPSLSVRHQDPEASRLLHRHRHRRDRHIRLVGLMGGKHHFIIHLINMVSGKNQHVIRMVAFHIVQILVNGIGSPCIPFTVHTLFIWRKNRNPAYIPVQIPRNPNPYMCIQPQRLILCQDSYRIHS